MTEEDRERLALQDAADESLETLEAGEAILDRLTQEDPCPKT